MTKRQHRRQIYYTARGARYVIRVSKKTGKRYKQYLPRRTKRIQNKELSRVKDIVIVPFR